ncbi:LOW QUALITY PROTEIN: granulocyte-macrophage colony-stimulating factor receptor subunit alpha-like [Aythya fuligula]|uniref:LOW QUALITY PROTEIN: granulocyte-macrophage colony-stimulating factor receptor subunit alpha-like n=1 Tax=Aythya fuligula TaxID=219594 RepID=A0A6J3CKX9_AYTFU|nr:LOW QUALITY PROTEIN: granulocyte-macrophage colony-stimulating factor receptor subunit alpha-like [Aythya fuligula]
MFDTLGLIWMSWWCMTLFHPLHADPQRMEPETKESPITNLTWNWRRMELSWESSKNFPSYTCTMISSDGHRRNQVKNRNCGFAIEGNLPLHRGINFTIEVPNTNISKHCRFIPEGKKGSAIENFSCVIYDVSLMNCTWQAGRNAPGDTQYFLYWKNSSDENESGCELYIEGENGMHTGCRFQNVMIEGKTAYFLVYGISNDSQIQFYDEYITLYNIERFTPPLNVSVNCTIDPAGCTITWQKPRTSYEKPEHCFEYEINIQNKDEPQEDKKDPPVTVNANKYEFKNYNVKKKYILKIRARGRNCPVNRSWGEWSEPIEFGEEKDYFLVVLLLLIVLGTIVVTLLFFFLCKRYCSFKRVFPPIPQPRDKFNTSHDENIQAENMFPSSLNCTKEVTMVEEMT